MDIAQSLVPGKYWEEERVVDYFSLHYPLHPENYFYQSIYLTSLLECYIFSTTETFNFRIKEVGPIHSMPYTCVATLYPIKPVLNWQKLSNIHFY